MGSSIQHKTLTMAENSLWCTRLLLITILNVCHAQPPCKIIEMCEMPNTRVVSTTSSLIARGFVYPASCPWYCLQRAECIATTYNQAKETCELHEADTDGGPCTTLSTDVASVFSMIKLPGVPCPKVSYNKYVGAAERIYFDVTAIVLVIKYLGLTMTFSVLVIEVPKCFTPQIGHF